jgi:hypothetical protein
MTRDDGWPRPGRWLRPAMTQRPDRDLCCIAVACCSRGRRVTEETRTPTFGTTIRISRLRSPSRVTWGASDLRFL